MNSIDELPIFALNTVLCPGGHLPLRVFEPRYVDMIKRCMSAGTPFGICLIRAGHEVGDAATAHRTGTLAHIVDFDLLDDGLLGITAQGGERFRIEHTRVLADQLLVAVTSAIPAEQETALPSEYSHLAQIVAALLEHFGRSAVEHERNAAQATWVGYRLTEMLPMPPAKRQTMLEMEDALLRLSELDGIVRQLVAHANQGHL
ncbi:MAG: peptidase S16 [Gammaproteobacteria bacterium]|nr:peptidase S16 [Gammaproteobacteria bacterium]